MQNPAPIQAVVVAGGQGTRMRSFTDKIPKALLPFRGRPLLEHLLLWLKAAGFQDAFLCLGHQAESIESFFGDGSRLGMRLQYQLEKTPRGTAGTVADLGPRLRGDALVVYGDLYIEMDCRRLLDFHRSHADGATLVARRTDHPLDSDLLDADEAGRVRKIFRLGKDGEASPGRPLACAAVWVVRQEVLKLAPRDSPTDFARDIFPKALSSGLGLRAFETREVVSDVGTPERYRSFLERFGGGVVP